MTASTNERTQGFSELGVGEVESEFLILLISRARRSFSSLDCLGRVPNFGAAIFEISHFLKIAKALIQDRTDAGKRLYKESWPPPGVNDVDSTSQTSEWKV